MNDRFKFRIALHQDKYEEYGLEKFKNQKTFEVKTLNVGYENSTVEIIADYPNGDWAVREIDKNDVDLMQCTGLKDKNGTLIYEGDIVKSDFEFVTKTVNPFLFKVGDVVFQNLFGGFAINSCRNAAPFQQAQLGSVEAENCEVIGNIYENKELLNEIYCKKLRCHT